MDRVLNQEEIDAIVNAARGTKTVAPSTEGRSVQRFTFRRSEQLSAEQARALSQLHEDFARRLTQTLGAFLNVAFECKLVSAEQIAFGEFIDRLSELSYMTSLDVAPMNGIGAIQIDNSLVFPLIDLLLGGTGDSAAMTRQVSEIESHIIAEVVKMICSELARCWRPFGIDVSMGARDSRNQVHRFFAPSERTLCLSFEIKLLEKQGMINIVFPAAVSNPLFRKMQAEVSTSPHISSQSRDVLAKKMVNCSFPVQLELQGIELTVDELFALSPGIVCNLNIPVQTPASFLVAGREAYDAVAVRNGRQRAAQIVKDSFADTEGTQELHASYK